MKTLCTFTRVAELRRVLPADDAVTLVFTPANGNAKPFAFLAYEGGQGVIVDSIPNALIQAKQWHLWRDELDQVLSAFERSRIVTVADEHGSLVMTAGGQSVVLGSITPAPKPTPQPPMIRPLAPRPATPPAAETQPHTQAFKILDAALRLSAASNGTPILERCTPGYQIMISDVMGYEFDTTAQDGTVITLVAGNSRKSTRYPALKAREWDTLLQLWKSLSVAPLQRNREQR